MPPPPSRQEELDELRNQIRLDTPVHKELAGVIFLFSQLRALVDHLRQLNGKEHEQLDESLSRIYVGPTTTISAIVSIDAAIEQLAAQIQLFAADPTDTTLDGLADGSGEKLSAEHKAYMAASRHQQERIKAQQLLRTVEREMALANVSPHYDLASVMEDYLELDEAAVTDPLSRVLIEKLKKRAYMLSERNMWMAMSVAISKMLTLFVK